MHGLVKGRSLIEDSLGETKLDFIPFPFSPYCSWQGFVVYSSKQLEYKFPLDRKFCGW
mgnify:CR=1 FL=1